jgi:hypothetical protein
MTDIISGFRDHLQLAHGANQPVEVGRLNLPVGTYSIWAKFYLGIPRPEGLASTVSSRLQAGNDFDVTIVTHDATIAFTSVALNVVHTFSTAGSAILTCEFLFADGDTDVEFLKITAVNAQSLQNHPLP